jgi:glycosyltransferase involved in cell wall biosynthesis
MRVLNVTQTYSPFFEFGGPPVKVRALSEALARRGHEVTVLTTDWGLKSRLPANALNGATQRTAFGWRQDENGVHAIYLPTWLHYRALSWNPTVKRFCQKELRNFDVVHIFGLYDLLGPRVAAACRAAAVPYVVEPIGMLMPIVRNFRLKQIYHRILGESLLSGARYLIATSEQEKEEIASADLPKEKIVLRRNGVEGPAALPEPGSFRAAQGISADVKLILFLGRLSEKKSPSLLLRAFATLSKSLKSTKLALVYAGPDDAGMKNRLTEESHELGIASIVQFCGALFGEEKWSAYRDADVFVLPSQNENFGNTAGEAAVAGTPVVITDRCGIAPLLADVAALVVPHDAEAIAKAMERVLIEPGLHARLAAGGRRAVSRLDWETPAREMELLYRRVIGEHRPG